MTKEYHWPKITAETPIDEIQRIHKDIWEYVIEHGEKPETPYHSNCVACTYAVKKYLEYLNKIGSHTSKPVAKRCCFCPIDWVFGGICNVPRSLYSSWVVESTIDKYSEEAYRLARMIRDIPFKKGESNE